MDLPRLPPLPPLKRAVKRLPRLKAELPIARDPEPDEVTEKTGPMQFGGTEEGRWFETTVKDGSVGGRCQKCGRKRKAENLKLTTLPFGRGEIWACKEGC